MSRFGNRAPSASRFSDAVPRRGALISATLAVFAICSVASAQSRYTEHTLTLDDPKSRPAASFEDIAWMVGFWQGEGFGGSAEEEWQAASGGTMAGVFKLMHAGQATMYEFMMIVEENESLEMRLKHFNADFTSWEDKAEYVSFPLVKLSEDAAYFDGLTYRRIGSDGMVVHVSIGEEKKEAAVEFVRRNSVAVPAGPSS